MKGLLILLLFAGLVYLMMRYGLGRRWRSKYIDPVCGMEVGAEEGYGKIHEDKSYRFCTRSCLNKFDADPARYLNPPPDEGSDGRGGS